MRSWPALRLGGQVFFCAAVLSFFAPFCRDLRFFWVLSALILAVSLAAVRLSRPLSRLALALVPALAFLVPVSGWISLAAGAAILLYVSIVLTRGDFFSDYRTYRLEGGWTLAVCVILAVVSFFRTEGGLSSLRFLICAALLVLLALRLLQVGGSMGPAWRAGSVGILGAVLAAGAAAGLAVWVLRDLFIGFFRLLGTGFAYLISIPLALLVRLWTALFGVSETEQDPGLPKLIFNIGGNPKPSSQFLTDTHYDSLTVRVPWMSILTVAAVVLLVLAAIWFIRTGGLRRLRKDQTRQANDTAPAVQRAKRKKSRREELDNRSQLRIVYSRYLDFLRKRGVELDSSNTTQEITDASSELFLRSDERLRTLYRKARYSSQEISDEDLRHASEILNRLISEENRRSKQQGETPERSSLCG